MTRVTNLEHSRTPGGFLEIEPASGATLNGALVNMFSTYTTRQICTMGVRRRQKGDALFVTSQKDGQMPYYNIFNLACETTKPVIIMSFPNFVESSRVRRC